MVRCGPSAWAFAPAKNARDPTNGGKDGGQWNLKRCMVKWRNPFWQGAYDLLEEGKEAPSCRMGGDGTPPDEAENTKDCHGASYHGALCKQHPCQPAVVIRLLN